MAFAMRVTQSSLLLEMTVVSQKDPASRIK